MVDDKSDEYHDGSFGFTETVETTEAMTNVNDTYQSMLSLPPSD